MPERSQFMEVMPHHRVVITGIGAITAIGSGREGLWRGIRRGESGIRRLKRFDPSPFGSQIAGEVTDFDPLAYFPARRVKRLDRFAQFALVAAKMASKIRNKAAGLLTRTNPPTRKSAFASARRLAASRWRNTNMNCSCARESAR